MCLVCKKMDVLDKRKTIDVYSPPEQMWSLQFNVTLTQHVFS